jgi:zinc-binding alcohol dehydrogenase family protein
VKSQAGTLLIVNGAGGVGSILTQIARRLTGLTVVTTASRPETVAWCYEMGAHHVIDHHRPFTEEFEKLGIAHVEYVASLTATGRHFADIEAVLAPQGRLALIDDPETLDIVRLKRKSISVHWELMFTRSLFQTADMIAQHRLLNEVADLLDVGVLRTTMTAEGGPITAENLKRVHALVESGHAIGKTVLTGFQI